MTFDSSNRGHTELTPGILSPVSPQASERINMSTMHCSLLSLGCIFGFAPATEKTSLTALRALKIAQRRLRPEVRSKLLSVSSPKTESSLAPEAWRFVFFDPGTSGNCRIVTVAAKTSSEHPDTVEAFSNVKTENAATAHAISQNKCVIDSDQVLAQVRNESKLKGIRSADYRLVQSKGTQEPLWTLSFYAESPEAVARFQIGAKTGTLKILPND